jgi:hypothetical protein
MPRKATNYANGIQYKIVCKDPAITDCYNGSCISFKDRKKQHKSSCTNLNNASYNYKVYRFIRENGGWSNWDMIQIEEFPCKSKQELIAREREIFDILKPTLNTKSPTLNVENKKMYAAKYMIEYVANHKEILKEYYAEYYKDNKEHLSAIHQQYYADNKVEIDIKQKEKVKCECGCVTNKHHLSRHLKSKKHLNLMNQLK